LGGCSGYCARGCEGWGGAQVVILDHGQYAAPFICIRYGQKVPLLNPRPKDSGSFCLGFGQGVDFCTEHGLRGSS